MKTIYLVIIIGFFVLTILRTILSAVGFKVPTTIDAWKAYVRGPGMLQLGFLILGAVVVVPGIYLAPIRSLPPASIVKEYRVDPSKQVVYQENIQDYSRLIVFARSQGSEKSAARLTIFRNRSGEGDGEISRIENITPATWTRLDLDNSYANMALMVEPSTQADAGLAKQVDILLYFKIK